MAALAAGILITGCGQSTARETTAAVSVQEAETQESLKIESSETEEAETETAAGGYEDNFSVDQAAAGDFARQIQDAVADKDLEKLADLTAFPVYVGLPESDGAVESREEFIALGADKVFTPELTASVAAADPDSLSPSMAGFVLSDGSSANIIFSVRDGKLAVSGINY